MTREIRNTPHPTPSPDGPHSANSGRGAGRLSQSEDEPAADELNYDSCMDDVNLVLSSPLTEPDPILKSQSSSSDTIPLAAASESAVVPSFLQERGKQPRTSEVFQRVGPLTADAVRAAVGPDRKGVPADVEITPEPETVFEGSAGAVCLASEAERQITELASEDEQDTESRLPWALLLLMSYSSAVTLALTWVLWTGRAFQSSEPSTSIAGATELESSPKSIESTPAGALPPLPAENVIMLGQTARLGDLEATPIDISSRPLELVRAIEPSRWRREESPSLVLRIKLKNVSTSDTFAPVERRFLREQTAAIDRSAIVTSQGQGINLFPLAVESEWSILSQEFPSLKAGESVETIIASEPGATDKLTDEAMWRVRLRVGPYRTDVLGVRFNVTDVTQ